MNKKAQVATSLLVVIALVFAAIALFMMISFSNDVKSQSAQLSALTNEIESNQHYITQKAILLAKETINTNPNEQTFKSVAGEHENLYRYPGAGNFYAQIRNHNAGNPTFTFQLTNGVYQLSIPDLFVRSQKGANIIKRNFDLCLEFDLNGDFKEKC